MKPFLFILGAIETGFSAIGINLVDFSTPWTTIISIMILIILCLLGGIGWVTVSEEIKAYKNKKKGNVNLVGDRKVG